jgi:hypothetical protein
MAQNALALSAGKADRNKGRDKEGIGGEAGIRTLGGLASSLVFKTSAFNRSATSPEAGKHTRKPPGISRESALKATKSKGLRWLPFDGQVYMLNF